jgi:hypothetical protein
LEFSSKLYQVSALSKSWKIPSVIKFNFLCFKFSIYKIIVDMKLDE